MLKNSNVFVAISSSTAWCQWTNVWLLNFWCGHWTTVVFIELLRGYWTNEKAHLQMLSHIGPDQRHEGWSEKS